MIIYRLSHIYHSVIGLIFTGSLGLHPVGDQSWPISKGWDFIVIQWDINGIYPLVILHSYRWPIEIVDLPSYKMVDLSIVIYVNVYQRVPLLVGGFNPSEKYEFVSWDDYSIHYGK